MSTQAVSDERVEMTRKTGARIQSEILRKLASVTQEHAADCMGVSASTVSRSKENLESFCQLLAAIGLQVVPANSIVANKDDVRALERMAFQYLKFRLESGEGAP